MKKLHLGNINFEWELKNCSTLPFKEAFHAHKHFLQLQFLPLLYARESDEVLVTHLPPEEFQNRLPLRLTSATSFPKRELETWGWSENGKKWADKRSVIYEPPLFQVVRRVASKAYGFTHSPTLPDAHLFHSVEEAEKWAAKGPYPKVLKTCYDLAGMGRFLLSSAEDFLRFKQRIVNVFKEGHPLIGEPWVKRLLDFSTQWTISKTGAITYLGATIMENKSSGQYKKTIVGEEKSLFASYAPFLGQHLEKVKGPLSRITSEGYFGHLGIDAMVYHHPTKKDKLLHPIVEFNLRKTMGFLALKLFEKQSFPFVELSYVSKQGPGLLPHFLTTSNGDKIFFQKQLELQSKRNR